LDTPASGDDIMLPPSAAGFDTPVTPESTTPVVAPASGLPLSRPGSSIGICGSELGSSLITGSQLPEGPQTVQAVPTQPGEQMGSGRAHENRRSSKMARRLLGTNEVTARASVNTRSFWSASTTTSNSPEASPSLRGKIGISIGHGRPAVGIDFLTGVRHVSAVR
jgi:hypothetical protein